jgi:hypothetical protein
MAAREALDRLVDRVATQVRWRRAEHDALRGVFVGAAAAVPVLLLRGVLDPWAVPAAVALVVAGLLVGGLRGLCRSVPAGAAARVADRGFGLQDRLATALEWADRPDRTPLVEALLADAEQRARTVPSRQVVPRAIPRQARWLPVPVVIVVTLALLPALPLPSGLPDMLASHDEPEPARETVDAGLMEQDRRTLPMDPLTRPTLEERDFAERAAGSGGAMAGDLNAAFKDTALAAQRPDFNSFLKKGDERLRMLEQVDRLPDLQSDYTQSPYQMVFQKSKALSAGLRPDQISPEKLRELLEEMERLGRRGGDDWGSDVSEGMEALDGGDPDRALQAMEKALDKLRAMEDQRLAGKSLRGGREADRGTGDGRDQAMGSGAGSDEDFGHGEGSMAGTGTSAAPKGDPSDRLRAEAYDASVAGDVRAGRTEGFDTNMVGRGGQMPSRLGYMGVIGQYRKMMEDTIAREQIPRDYHAQIKEYFQSLERR